MRCIFNFGAFENLVLPIQYNYFIQSMIYRNISHELATFLHDNGFTIDGRRFKLFTFSRLEGRFKIKNKIFFKPPIKLTVVSPVERFLRELAEGMIRNNNLNICGQKIFLESAEILPSIEEQDIDDEIKIKMLSPVVAYNSVQKEGTQKTFYFSPWDEWFSELLSSNLQKKYKLITGENRTLGDIKIIPIGPKNDRYCKIMNYKGTIIKGWMGIYMLRGDKKLIKTAYDTGLGAKNSQGFGCFEILEGINLKGKESE